MSDYQDVPATAARMRAVVEHRRLNPIFTEAERRAWFDAETALAVFTPEQQP